MTHEDGTDRVFRNVGTENTDAGESPKSKYKTREHLVYFDCTNLIFRSNLHFMCLIYFCQYCTFSVL